MKGRVKTAQQVGESLRALRMKSGLSGQEIRARAKVASLARVEEGLASVGDMDRVARVLGTTLGDVVHKPVAFVSEEPPHVLTHVGSAILALHVVGSKVDAAVDAAVEEAIRRTGGNQSEAARLLGMERKAFVRRLARARRAAKVKKR